MLPWILWREKTDGQRDSQGELGYNPATRPCAPKETGGGANRQGYWRHCSLLRLHQECSRTALPKCPKNGTTHSQPWCSSIAMLFLDPRVCELTALAEEGLCLVQASYLSPPPLPPHTLLELLQALCPSLSTLLPSSKYVLSSYSFLHLPDLCSPRSRGSFRPS